MRVLLRNRQTKLYYVGPRQLDTRQEQAVDFGSVSSAAKFAGDEKLRDMEIILRFDSCGGEIPLPVLPEWCLFEERALRPAADPAPPNAALSSSPSRLS
jgi:hypothetical protein